MQNTTDTDSNISTLVSEALELLCQETLDVAGVRATLEALKQGLDSEEPADLSTLGKRSRSDIQTTGSGIGSVTMNKKGTLPLGITWVAFTSGLIPILEDSGIVGEIDYLGFNQHGCFTNYEFSGPCPIHKRIHDGQAWKWSLKYKKAGDYSYWGFKCWRDDAFQKIAFGIPELEI